jgi:hypothetical protein
MGASVDAPNESEVGTEIGVVAPVEHGIAEVASVLLQKDAPTRPAGFDPVLVPVQGLERDEVQLRRAAQTELPVDARGSAVAVEELAVGHQRADVRLGVQVVTGAASEYLGRLARGRIRVVSIVSRRRIVGHEEANRRASYLAGEFGPVARVHDGPRVQPGHRREHIKDLLPFQEERAELGEEQWEPLVERDLRDIGFDLGKVGIKCEVGREVRAHPVLDVQSGLGCEVGRGGAGRVIPRLEPDRGDGGEDLQVPAGGDTGHPLEDTHLGQEPGDIARHRGPDIAFVVLAANRSDDLEPPAV